MDTLHVVPGYRCNKLCGHCASDSGPGRRGGLTDTELQSIVDYVSQASPSELMFTGGEPTLYVPTLNAIMSSHSALNLCKVHVTTNGWFTRLNDKRMAAVIGSITKIDHVQLSFDSYHENSDDLAGARRLQSFCAANGIGFNLSISVSSVEQAAAAAEAASSLGCEFAFNKVEASGRARVNGLSFAYPEFDHSVLETTCPNLFQMSFIPARGFTVCCANVVYNEPIPGTSHATVDEHIQSPFYKGMITKSFRQRLAEAGMTVADLQPRHSLACNLCEHIERRRAGLGVV